MKAMILAAGRGERMRPLTDHTPKPLLTVAGKPLIVWHLERLARAGFRQIVINHAHLGAQIEAALGNGQLWDVSIQYSAEETALETAGGIVKALPLLGNQPFLVVNGDIFAELDFASLKHALRDDVLGASRHAHLVLVDNPLQHPLGDFGFRQASDSVHSELSLNGLPRLTFSGIGVYRPALFDGLLPGQPAKLAPLLQLAIRHNRASAEHYNGIWHDIGTPERLQGLNQELEDYHG